VSRSARDWHRKTAWMPRKSDTQAQQERATSQNKKTKKT